MRGAEGADERGVEGARGGGLEGVSTSVGLGFFEGLCSSPNFFSQIHVIIAHFAEFCEDYDSLRFMKFKKSN